MTSLTGEVNKFYKPIWGTRLHLREGGVCTPYTLSLDPPLLRKRISKTQFKTYLARHQASKQLNLSYISLPSRFDHLMISNDQNYKYGEYCGERTGHTVLVSGSYVVIRFNSDELYQLKGFLLVFTAVQIRKYEARTPPQQRTKREDQEPYS